MENFKRSSWMNTSPTVKPKSSILTNSLAEMGINTEDIENIQLTLKQLRKGKMNSDKKMRLNAYMAEWSNVIRILDCGYKAALKHHKDIIMAASKTRCAPMRHMMIAIIGLMASVIVVALTRIFSEQMALLLGCVTLIFSTFEYWLRKGLLESYLLDWSKKYRRISFVNLPHVDLVSVELLTWERQVRREFECYKRRIKLYQDEDFIRSEMETFLVDSQVKLKSHLRYRSSEFLGNFRVYICASFQADLQLLVDQLDVIKQGVAGIVNFDSVKEELTQKIWKLWLEEQEPDFLNQLIQHRFSRRYLCILREELESAGIHLCSNLRSNQQPESQLGSLVDQLIHKMREKRRSFNEPVQFVKNS